MPKPSLPVAALILAAGATTTAPALRLEFSPVDGESLSLEFERVLTLELSESEMTLTYDGEVQEEQEPPGIELVMTEREVIRFTDRYQVQEGSLLGLRRSFEEIGNHFSQEITDPAGESFERENEGTSELEGEAVEFHRGSEAEAFTVSFAEDSQDLDPALLEGLEARADLAGFLPAGEVEVGDSWDVPAQAFVSMTNLSGDLHVRQEGEDEQQSGDYGRQFDENLAGELRATLSELREADGRRLAALTLELELSTRIEISREVEEEDIEGSEEETHAFGIELEGELLWDLGGGHAARLDLAGEVSLSVRVKKAYTFDGHEMEIVEAQAFEGRITFEAAVE